jgi:hypothetical protein
MSSNTPSLSDSDEPSISSDIDIHEIPNSIELIDSSCNESGSESECESESENECFDEIEMLTEMSREDLFLYIKTDPGYYLDLIEQNRLGQQLAIIPSRDEQGNLRIKFKIHPGHRWTEVGYFSKCSDSQVLEEFVNQINHNIHRTPVDPRDRVHSHLESQLDGNNNMQSTDYMKDVEAIRRKRNNELPTQLRPNSKTKSESQPPSESVPQLNLTPKTSPSQPQAQSQAQSQSQAKSSPVKTQLEQYTDQLVERLIEALPDILVLEKRSYQYSVLSQISRNEPSDQLKPIYHEFVQNLKNRDYIYSFHTSIDWSRFPELRPEIVTFHREALKTSPTIYQNLNFEKAPLDELDYQILEKYGLKVEEVWADYLEKHSVKN